MEFPPEILSIIKEYIRPIGLRLDWRKGCYCNRNWYDNGTYYFGNANFKMTIKLMRDIADFRYSRSFIDLWEIEL